MTIELFVTESTGREELPYCKQYSRKCYGHYRNLVNLNVMVRFIRSKLFLVVPSKLKLSYQAIDFSRASENS